MGEVTPVSLQVIPDLEQCFMKNMYVFELQENGAVVPIYESFNHFEEELKLNLHDHHLSLITDFQRYAKKYTCQHCQKLFDHRRKWKQHQKNCPGIKKLQYVGGIYTPPCSFSEEMYQRTGERPFFPWFIVYEF